MQEQRRGSVQRFVGPYGPRFDSDSNCIYGELVEFLLDRSKDRINRKKHGISLSRAIDFDFDAAIFVIDDRKDYG